MRRLLLRSIVGLALLLALAVVWLFLRPPDPVTIELVNASHKPIERVLIRHLSGTEVVGSIPVGESKVVTFQTRGETEYSLRVRFADGTQALGEGSYAEAGYTFTETISDSSVQNELRGMRY